MPQVGDRLPLAWSRSHSRAFAAAGNLSPEPE
jgi:hypothetical protein